MENKPYMGSILRQQSLSQIYLWLRGGEITDSTNTKRAVFHYALKTIVETNKDGCLSEDETLLLIQRAFKNRLS